MSQENYSFDGNAPLGISIQNNVDRASEYQRTHTPAETAEWFYQVFRNNHDQHLSVNESMDYKQIDKAYADFGNYNYGVVSKTLGLPDWIALYGAGWAQGKADGLSNGKAIIRAVLDSKNRGDNPEDQRQIEKGIQAATEAGIAHSDLGMKEYLSNAIRSVFDDSQNVADLMGQKLSPANIDAFCKTAHTWLQRHDPSNVNNLNALKNVIHKINANDDIDTIKQKVNAAKSTSSPIILDLNNNGIETTGLNGWAYFDHAGDSFAERTGWVGRADGLLVRDINNNGRIDNGNELFGSETLLVDGNKAANGFEALKTLDSNGDNQINADDAACASLQIWIDADGDGSSQPNELSSLQAAGVVAIATNYSNSDVIDNQGNTHRQIGVYIRADGSQAAAEDVWFAVDKTYSIAETWVDVPDDIAGDSPDLSGYGVVRDLWQAIALDSSNTLKTLVASYQTETDEGQRRSLVNDIIYRWTSADQIAPQSRGSYVDARQLVALEHLLGENFYQTDWGINPGDTAGKKIGAAFTELSNSMFLQLEAQTQFTDLYAQVRWQWDNTTQTLQPDLINIVNTLQNQLTANPTQGLVLLDGFARNLKALGWTDSSTWRSLNDGLANNADALNVLRLVQLDTLTGSAESNHLNGSITDERLLGFGGDDVLNGLGGDDVLEGGDDNDTLEAGAGNDTIEGGKGNDVLDGNTGSDIYVFQHGFGNDHIHQYDSASDAIDVAHFSSLSTQNIVQTIRQGDDLTLIFTTGDQLTVDGYFGAAARRIDSFDFANGEHWDLSAIKVRVDTLGTIGDDSLYGYTMGNNQLFGLSGNDELHGNTGNDLVDGGEGNDTLYGQSGDDTLDGGAGDDVLKGGTGNDTYKINAIGDSVVEAVNAGLDTVLSSISYTLTANTENLTLMATAGNLNATGNSLDNLLLGNEGDNILSGSLGNDTLDGGAGNDIYIFGKGDGQDVILGNRESDVGEFNILQLKSGITPSEIATTRLGNDLVLSIVGTTDKITASSFFSDTTNNIYIPIQQVSFNNGTVWDMWTFNTLTSLYEIQL